MVALLTDSAHPPLEDRIASVMGIVNAAAAELIALIAEALDTEAWQGDGIRSAEHWVALQCGVSGPRAAALVATARGLADLPICRGLFEKGALSEDQAREIARRTDAAHDAEAADLAPHATVAQLRHALRRLPPPEPTPQPDPDTGKPDDPTGETPNRREVAFGYRGDGRWWCRAVLPAEEGAVIQAALERARDAEFRLRHPDPPPPHDDDDGRGAGRGGEASDNEGRSGVTWADGLARMAEAALTALDTTSGRPGDRYQVYLHVRADAPMSAYLHLGPSVDDSVRRYLTCDAPIRLVFEQEGRIVALSEKQDTVDTKTRKLTEQRDGGCTVPGCGQHRWLHIHHIVHREDGGPTTLDNLCCLCPMHHRLHHAGLLEIRGDPTRPGGLEFITPGGRRLGPAPPRPPGAPLREAARRLGIDHAPYRHPTGERADWRWFWWS